MAVISASDVHTFAYDGVGRRVVETANGVTTRLLWCGEAICQSRNASDTPVAYHYPQGELAGSQRLNYATDHLGSVREVRNLATGQTVAARDYGHHRPDRYRLPGARLRRHVAPRPHRPVPDALPGVQSKLRAVDEPGSDRGGGGN